MNTFTKRSNGQDHLSHLADDLEALLQATASATEEAVVQARNRLKHALDSASEACDDVREKALQGATAADKMVRANPYPAIGLALGVGALVGFLLGRRNQD